MDGDAIGDDEQLLRFLHPRGNQVVMEAGEYQVTSAAFLDVKALKVARTGRSLFVESNSNLERLERHFRVDHKHGLARIRVADARECGFSLLVDESELFPEDAHILLRPDPGWSRNQFKVKAEQLAALAVLDYPPEQ